MQSVSHWRCQDLDTSSVNASGLAVMWLGAILHSSKDENLKSFWSCMESLEHLQTWNLCVHSLCTSLQHVSCLILSHLVSIRRCLWLPRHCLHKCTVVYAGGNCGLFGTHSSVPFPEKNPVQAQLVHQKDTSKNDTNSSGNGWQRRVIKHYIICWYMLYTKII